jgi:Flp pilus assembly protein TadD
MLQEIETLMQQGRWDDASSRLQAMLQVQPVNPKLHAYLGCCHFRKNEFEKAAECFRRAVTLDPKYWEAGLKLAQSLDRLMRYKEALQVAEEFLHLRPNEGSLQALVNGLRRQQGAVEEESWQKSTKPMPHSVTLAQD